ncbi:MAG TPA: 5'/3'-nucleotidase SurE [Gammaproteobacteria bacterium]|jgi:5'-nucleotidase|nr:5'/3'-nucleotidase SurE [Gammaproteobacteria bacterium]
MRILVANDDGYLSEGISALAQALARIAEVNVVAPDRNCSAASHSLTLRMPLRTAVHANGFTSVEGTPTDCVHLAVNGMLGELPDMVVSGINDGPNMGDDVLYSGTVAAAIEGRFLGLPAIAVSMASPQPQHYATAGRVIADLVSHLQEYPIDENSILNVNVPDLPYEAIQGMQGTRLGSRHKSESVIEQRDPRGQPIYWLGPAGPEADAGPGTDFYAVKNGFVSVTPLQIDLTRHDAIADVNKWLGQR